MCSHVFTDASAVVAQWIDWLTRRHVNQLTLEVKHWISWNFHHHVVVLFLHHFRDCLLKIYKRNNIFNCTQLDMMWRRGSIIGVTKNVYLLGTWDRQRWRKRRKSTSALASVSYLSAHNNILAISSSAAVSATRRQEFSSWNKWPEVFFLNLPRLSGLVVCDSNFVRLVPRFIFLLLFPYFSSVCCFPSSLSLSYESTSGV